jgi:uncharacterized protein YlxW (UPF0749 family)
MTLDFRFFILLLLLQPFSISLYGQESAASDITDSFDQILEEHRTWETYKVVPVTRMEAFANALKDSVEAYNQKIASLSNAVKENQQQLDKAREDVSQLRVELSESERRSDEILFLGMAFGKASYHTLVWGLIVLLFGFSAFTYLLFLRSNRVTRVSKKEREDLMEVLEEQRTKSREREVKLKRELQTVINQLNERG